MHHPRKKKLFFHLFSFFLFLQRNCIEFALNAKPVRRYIPKNPIQYKLWAFVTSPVFEYTIFAMILINTLSLAMKFYQQPELYTQFLDVLNVIFTVFFTMEFVFKLGAFRFKVNVCTISIFEFPRSIIKFKNRYYPECFKRLIR